MSARSDGDARKIVVHSVMLQINLDIASELLNAF